MSQSGHRRLGQVISEAASALVCIGLGLCPGTHVLAIFPHVHLSRRHPEPDRWALHPHLTFSPVLTGPTHRGAYLTARASAVTLSVENSLFSPPHLQPPRPGKTCLNLGTPARPHLRFQPTCWGQTGPETQLVSPATLVPPPTRPTAPWLETPRGRRPSLSHVPIGRAVCFTDFSKVPLSKTQRL